MTEIVHPRGGTPVTLRPCPPWCTCSQHFADDQVVDVDDGYHHCGPEVSVPTSDRMLHDDPEVVVKVALKAWTPSLDADANPARIELQLGAADHDTDMYAELTPAEARAVASALLELASVADNPATG